MNKSELRAIPGMLLVSALLAGALPAGEPPVIDLWPEGVPGLRADATAEKIDGDHVKILAEFAIQEAQIDENAAEKAIQRAEEALKGAEKLDPSEVERLEALVRFSVAQLGVKRKRR